MPSSYGDDFELHEEFGEADMRGRAVENDAHGAFGRVGAEVDDRAREAFIARMEGMAMSICPSGSLLFTRG